MYSGRVRLSRTATSPDSGETRRSAPRTSLHVRLIQPLQAKTPGHTGAPRSRHAAARHGHKQGAMPSNPARSCPGDARPADSMTKRGCLFRQAVPSGTTCSHARPPCCPGPAQGPCKSPAHDTRPGARRDGIPLPPTPVGRSTTRLRPQKKGAFFNEASAFRYCADSGKMPPS